MERIIANLKYGDSHSSSIDSNSSSIIELDQSKTLNQELDPEILAEIKRRYGFDKPLLTRFFSMIKSFIFFDFGDSFFKGKPVITLIKERLPVSISLGLWSTLIIYLISIPLGIRKAVKNGTNFDLHSSIVIFIFYAIPSFLLGLLLLTTLGNGGLISIFPVSGLTSDNFSELSFIEKTQDYFMHIILPSLALIIGGFASLTLLTKNSFIEELSKQYVITATAKGLDKKSILYKHIFRNAMILIISQIPETLIKILLTGALLIEIIFSLDGLGLLSFEAITSRDYPVIFANLYIYSLIALVFNLISDIIYVVIDPRIDFNKN